MAAFQLGCKAVMEGERASRKGPKMQGNRNEEQLAQGSSDVQRVIEESRNAIERLRLRIRWRTLEVIRASSRK